MFPYLYLVPASLSQIANLPTKLKLCVGTAVMMTDNISVCERLINVSIGTHVGDQSHFAIQYM